MKRSSAEANGARLPTAAVPPAGVVRETSSTTAEVSITTGCNDNVNENKSTSTKKNVRMMIHAVDGLMPYLTPHLLRRCLPPSEVRDLMLVGIPVRDTCVVPVYKESGGKKDGNKKKQIEPNGNDVGKKKTKKSDGDGDGKIRGYDFSSSGFKIDSWMLAYQRVTVPAFELRFEGDDSYGTSLSPPAEKQKSKKQKKCCDAVTDRGVHLRTPKGRITLTPDRYCGIAKSAALCRCSGGGAGAARSSSQSQQQQCLVATVSMFDAVPVAGLDDSRHRNNPYHKRRESAARRCREWFRHFVDCHHEAGSAAPSKDDVDGSGDGKDKDSGDLDASTNRIWAPIAVDQEGDVVEGQLDAVRAAMDDTRAKGGARSAIVDGAVAIGWNHVGGSPKRRSAIRTIKNELLRTRKDANVNATIAVLSTNSLSQVLDAFLGGCNIIGTDLPRLWAHANRAFVLDVSGWRQSAGVCGGASSSSSVADVNVTRKKARVEKNCGDGETSASAATGVRQSLGGDGCVDLSFGDDKDSDVSSHSWFRDPNPMVQGCSCLACATHTRAYMYHLVCAKELLGEIMVFIHNLHQFLELFRQMNAAINEGGEERLVEYIQSQLPNE